MKTDITVLVVPEAYIDCYGHVHYTDYLTIFENARIEFLSKRCILLADLEERNMRLVTRAVKIEYDRELLLGDRIAVDTAIAGVGRTSLSFSQCITREPGARPSTDAIATCEHIFVLIDRTTRQKIVIPDELRMKLLS